MARVVVETRKVIYRGPEGEEQGRGVETVREDKRCQRCAGGKAVKSGIA